VTPPTPPPGGPLLAAATGRGFTTTTWVALGVVVVLVAGSAVLAIAETSLTRMSKAKAASLVEEHRRGAATLARLVERPERFLSAVLLMELLCQLVAATLVGVVADRLFGTLGVVVATVAEVVVIFVLGEATPKNWAVQQPERAALVSAPLVGGIVRFPLVRLVSGGLVGLSQLLLPRGDRRTNFVTEQELLALADQAAAEDVIEREERALIRSIIDFGDTVVREVMVPRTDMVTVDGRARVADALEVAMQAGYSRLPVYGQNVDDVVGILYTKDLVKADLAGEEERVAAELARPAHFAPETKAVAELMREMQQGKFHMAIVVDEYGGTAGVVTLEDLIEELVGEIVDEFDVEEPAAEPLGGGAYRVNARMPLDEVNELLGADLPEGDWDTVGGLVFGLLGHVPTEGESAEVGEYRLVAEKVQGRRIGRVRIVPLPSGTTEEPASPTGGGDELPHANSGTDELPHANSGTDELPHANSGTDELPHANSGTDELPAPVSGTDGPLAGPARPGARLDEAGGDAATEETGAPGGASRVPTSDGGPVPTVESSVSEAQSGPAEQVTGSS